MRAHRDYYPSQLFRRIPNRRVLPDYHEIIKEPSAISTLKQKIQRKQYTGIPEFVRDFAMIVHNAQVYNRPKSGPVRDIFLLQDVFKEELKKLVTEGLIKEEETGFPDLGEIPDATPEPTPVSDDERTMRKMMRMMTTMKGVMMTLRMERRRSDGKADGQAFQDARP